MSIQTQDTYKHLYITKDNSSFNIITDILKNITNQIPNIKSITHVYQQKYIINNNIVNSRGLGDFIRGSYWIMQFCKYANILFNMNINHPINNYLLNKTHEINRGVHFLDDANYRYNIQPKNMINAYYGFIKSFIKYVQSLPINNGNVYVYNIGFPILEIEEYQRQYIRNIFTPSIMMNTYIDQQLSQLGLEKNNYNIIHIRIGDNLLVHNTQNLNNNVLNSLINKVKGHINDNENYLVLSDNKIFKDILKNNIKNNIKLLNNNISHLGEGTNLTNMQIVKDNMLEFYLMSLSKDILAYSVYYWGSGFSKWCAETYNIPYRSYHFWPV